MAVKMIVMQRLQLIAQALFGVWNMFEPGLANWGFPSMGVSENEWFIRENLIKMNDLGVPWGTPIPGNPNWFGQLTSGAVWSRPCHAGPYPEVSLRSPELVGST